MELITQNGTGLSISLENVNLTSYSNHNSSNGIDFQWFTPLEGIQSKLRWVFSFHTYFFGCMFFILGFCTFSSILNIRSQISRKRFMSGINTFLCIFGLSRAASLFIDPYGSLKLLPAPITNMVWAIGFPSLTSSFCLLQLAFLHLTKLKFGFKLLRIEILLRSIITLHIFSSVLRAVISSLHWSTKIVVINYIFEFAFLCWALFLHASFLHIGYNSFKLLDRVPATMLQPHGCLNKGINQLVMLAPASNLVTSVTAALMPTVLGPAASLTTNKISTPGQAVIVRNEKTEPTNIVLPSTSTSKLGQFKGKQMSTRATNPFDTNTSKESFAKTKKLTWQASITNGKSESNITESKIIIDHSVTKKPILKDINKSCSPKIEISSEINENKSKLPFDNNLEINEKDGNENGLFLHTVLNHIAYVNRVSGGSDIGISHCSHDATPTSRKKQVRFILKIVYSTAILGLCLTLAEFFQKFGPYGLMKYFLKDDEIKPLPWLLFQTFCRTCEILMSSGIANVTRQSAASIGYYKHSPAVIKQRGSMFM